MTIQAPETIWFNGVEHRTMARPLSPLLQLMPQKLRPEFYGQNSILSACHRGYIGTWEILSDHLYLVGLEDIAIPAVFESCQARAYAHWVNGFLPLWSMGEGCSVGANLALEVRRGKVIRAVSGSEVIYSDQLLTWENAEAPRAPGKNELWSMVDVDLVRGIERLSDPLQAVPNTPFGHMSLLWEEFEAILGPGTTIWSYEIIGHEARAQSGYAAIRNNEILDFVCTEFISEAPTGDFEEEVS